MIPPTPDACTHRHAVLTLVVVSSFADHARKFVVPDRVTDEMQLSAVISKRSEKSRVSEDAFLGVDDGCMRSLPLVEMTAGAGRDDNGGRSRGQRGQVEMTEHERA